MAKIPRSKSNDQNSSEYSTEMAATRRQFVKEKTGAEMNHVGTFSIEPDTLPGNIEHFTGVAQVPIGLAGPLIIEGVDAHGEFYVPMATTEGTLVASYNRGMRLTAESGGVKTTVIDDAMQRAPVFVFEDARAALAFGKWVTRWLRFNFTCGDAAGQNMVSKATRHACQWMQAQHIAGLEHFALSGNLDTDKKHSFVNSLHTRGKRVVAEATIPADLMKSLMHCSPEALFKQRQLSNMGAFVAGSVSNGAHFANGITALFIACGQDVANVAESSAGYTYSEITPNGDYYFSITIPSLVVASYGGGTGLATQRECLETLGCYGKGGVNKLAEIIAATVLCGELSLGAAVVADEWVSSHDEYGRNRP